METSAFGIVHKAMSPETQKRKKKGQAVQTAGGVGGIAGGVGTAALGTRARGKLADANFSDTMQRIHRNSANHSRDAAETISRSAQSGAGSFKWAKEQVAPLGRNYGQALDAAEKHKNTGTIALKQGRKLARGSLAAAAAGGASIGVGYQGKKIADKPKTAGKFGFGKR